MLKAIPDLKSPCEDVREQSVFTQENGRLLKTIEQTIRFYAVGTDVFVLSWTQFQYAGDFASWAAKNPDHAKALDAAIAKGRKSGRSAGIFFDEETDTLRQWPQNYCLAVRSSGASGKFVAKPDKGACVTAHNLTLALRGYWDSPSEQTLAHELTLAFWGDVG